MTHQMRSLLMRAQFDVDFLIGPAMAQTRKELARWIIGPKIRSGPWGINDVRRLLAAFYGIREATCDADRAAKLKAAIEADLAVPCGCEWCAKS